MSDDVRGMSPLEMIEEWRKGCSIAGPRSKGIGITDGVDSPELCPDCTLGLIVAMEKHFTTMLPHVRALRLWHWQMAMHYRSLQKNDPRAEMKRQFDAQAGHHIKCVQTLNDFFPIGDTAENDNAVPTD